MKALLLALFIVLTVHTPLISKIKFSGNIYGYNGKPMKTAVIYVYYWTDNRKDGFTDTVKLQNESFYSIDLPAKSGLYLAYAGVDHNPVIIDFMMPKDEDLNIDVYLAANRIEESSGDYKIIGDFNDFDFNSGIDMVEEQNGIYSAKVPNTGDTLWYQILGLVNTPIKRSVNGTQADIYRVDAGYDFRSGIITSDKNVNVKFNSNNYKLPEMNPRFASNEKEIELFLNEGWAYDKWRDDVYDKFYNKFYGSRTKDETLINDLLRGIEKRIDVTDNLYLIEKYMKDYFFTFRLSDFFDMTEMLDDKYALKMFTTIPTESDFWTNNAFIAGYAMMLAGTENVRPYVEKIISYDKDNQRPKWMQNCWISAQLATDPDNDKLIEQSEKEVEDFAYILSTAFSYADHTDNGNTDDLYDILRDKYPNSVQTMNIKIGHYNDREVETGEDVPEFEVNLLDSDETVSNETFKGKWLLIDFWATWCGPCLGEMKWLHEAWDKYKDKNFVILSISHDVKSEKINQFREKEWKMPWLHAFVEGKKRDELSVKFEVYGIPRPLLISPDGEIVAEENELRGEQLDKTLSKFLDK